MKENAKVFPVIFLPGKLSEEQLNLNQNILHLASIYYHYFR